MLPHDVLPRRRRTGTLGHVLFYDHGRRYLASLLVCLIGLVATGSSRAADFESVGLYQSFDELVTWTSDFAAANSDLVRVVEFGRSYQDRPLISLQLSVQPGVNDPAKPEFLFTGGVHAREVIGSEAAYRLAEHLVDGYRSGDPVFQDIFAEREIWIVPNLNPDGRHLFQPDRVAADRRDSGEGDRCSAVPIERRGVYDGTRTVDVRAFLHGTGGATGRDATEAATVNGLPA